MGLYGWRLASLIVAALVGGYALATAAGIAFGLALPVATSESALIGNMISFAVYTGAIIWAFHRRRPGRVWLMLLLSSSLLALVSLALKGSGS